MMKNITNISRNDGVISGTVVCPCCGDTFGFTEGTNGNATVISVGENKAYRLQSGTEYMEQHIQLELNAKCNSCGFTVRANGELINEK
jgi:hypothetical protein